MTKGPQRNSERAKKAKRVVAQAKTVAHQWSGIVAESFGLRNGKTPSAGARLTPPACEIDLDRWSASALAACWLGHATTLLRVGGANILTDPHFDERAGVRIAKRKIGRRRTIGVPIEPENLLPIDLVLLSHAHMDHWDKDSLRRLVKQEWAKRAVVLIPPGTRRLLPAGFGTVIELGWEGRAEHGGVSLKAIRPRHWGARFLWDRQRGYNAYLIEHAALRVLFGGDTAHTHAFDHLGKVHRRGANDRAGVDLAVMGIGSYEPWHEQHATPEQVAEMAKRMQASLLMPIHHATFEDSNVPLSEPLERLVKAWDPERMVCPRVGDVWYSE